MTASGSQPTCVFCGRAIDPGEPTSGRPPMAAHAACADAALADDQHWDAIASGEPDVAGEEAGPGTAPAKRRRGAGCLSILAVSIVPIVAVGALAASWPL